MRNVRATNTLLSLHSALSLTFIIVWMACNVVGLTVAQNGETSLVLQLKDGKIQGKLEPVPGGQDVEVFLGVPYAEPPTGELRFAATRPATPWSGVRDTTRYGAICPRGYCSPTNLTSKASIEKDIQSEDCLFLNVFRPANKTRNHMLPVMVWIHGGGFYRGSANLYDGSAIASHNDVIVVTLNYRLGLLGFLNIPGSELKGNYGMLDQVQVLKWVQQNIDGFGGNPSRVTIFGESAGGASVALHILSPLSKGLFQYAILQSGAASAPYGSFTTEKKTWNDIFLNRLNCLNNDRLLSCLRAKTFEDFVEAVAGKCDMVKLGTVLPVPTVDGEFLIDEPSVLFSKGQFNKLDAVVIGMTNDEGAYFSHVFTQSPTPETFRQAVKNFSFTQNGEGDLVKQAIVYKYTNHTDPTNPLGILENWHNLLSDSYFLAPSVLTAKNLERAGIPTYFYHLSHRATFSTYPPWVGCTHFDDIQYVFGVPWKWNPALAKASAYTDVERGLSSFIMKMWTNFAKYGNPGRNGLVTWPRYLAENQEYLDINLVPRVHRKLHAHRAAFWNEFVRKLEQHVSASPGRPE